ncbi:hypothetical protein ASF65_19235 [Aureimonas sp. Leaf324]|nr:hypothetical protein ASF65_19235 [Aureimonas sp. Leaf324]
MPRPRASLAATKRWSAAAREAATVKVDRCGICRMSVRNERGFLVTPTSLPYDRMQPEDLVQMSFGGTYEGPRRPSSEWRVHRDILAARPDVDCVLHCHCVYATTLAVHHHDIASFHDMTTVAA